jgi:hypothetical protein
VSTSLLSLFKEQLENESRALARTQSLSKRGDHLIWWYFSRLRGLDPAIIAEIVCDGGNDLGIDAIWIDDDDLVHFYTFKHPENPDAMFAAGDIDKTLGGLRLVLSRQHQLIANPELRDRVEEIYQTVPRGYQIHVVTSGTGIPKEAEIKLSAFVSGLGGPSDDFCRWELEDLAGLQDTFYRKHLPTVEDPIIFSIDLPPYQVRAADHDSYLFHANAFVLAELYEKYGEQLLQQNIRVYQGDGATNSLIRKTATLVREAENFFHYNNGITFLCEVAQWDGFTRKLTLRKAQVVNGGQTMRVLFDAYSSKELQKSVFAPIRVITSQGDKEFASNVAVNLNNQNRIEPSFLRSNDPRIVQLASALASMGWYLERRESEIENLTQLERTAIESRIGGSIEERAIRLKEGSQHYVATYMRQPEWAKKNPKKIFLGAADGGYFERVFNNQLTAEKFVLAHRLAHIIDEFVRQFMARKRRADKVDDWRKEYSEILGDDLVAKHSDVLNQVVPQSAIFLTALVFDYAVVAKQRQVEEVLQEIGQSQSLLCELLMHLIDTVKGDPSSSKSWPTLLKSQVFFDRVAAFLRGRASA